LQRTRLAHATLQAIADECGADILHIKGPAIDVALLPSKDDAPPDATATERAIPRLSQDADVLVRPAHLKRFLAALKQHGWIRKTSLYSGGAVEHSVDWWHPKLGGVDIHVRFPGIRLAPDVAFTELWGERRIQEIAHRLCPVPSVEAQRLVMLLHAARNGGPDSADVASAWTRASAAERGEVQDLASRLRADVALAGATRHLHEYTHHPEYDLWRLLGQGDADAFALWLAFVKAAPSTTERLRAILYALHTKTDQTKPRPTLRESLSTYRTRITRGAAGVLTLVARR